MSIPPKVIATSIERQKLSPIPPMDRATLKFKFDQDVTDWAVMVLGADYSTGTMAGNGKGGTKDVEISVDITHQMLYQEGDNRINIYGRNTDGQWTPFVPDTPPVNTKIYGVRIDTLNSSPAGAVTYTDDAIGMTPSPAGGGVSAWDDAYPFNQIKPCLFKIGAVNYYIRPDDYTKKLDGTNADITSGNDGDVMVEFPKLWWKFETIGNYLDVKYSNVQVDPTWKCHAHTRGTTEKDFAYIGAYLGFNTGGKLRSLSGKAPTASQTIGVFRTQAQANGAGYDQMGYYQLLMLQVLFLIRHKSRDSQTALGRGFVDGNASATSTGATNTKGTDFGEITGKQQMKFCGIEDFWGNLYYWIDGMFSDANRNILLGTENFNNTGAGYINYGQGATKNLTGLISSVQGGTETGFIMKENQGVFSQTYYSDSGNLNASYLPIFGGNWNQGDPSGAFRLVVFYGNSEKGSHIGARLFAL